MRKPKKRKINLARIRQTRTYTTAELSKLLDVHINTIRGYTKQGLKPIDATWPVLFHGSDVKEYLAKRQSKNKCVLEIDEFYCLKCRKPRKPLGRMVDVTFCNQKMANMSALCEVCETKMNRRTNIQRLPEYLQPQDSVTLLNPHLLERIEPSLNCYFEQTSK
ncbi:MAG: hypothetical protein FD163_639 [Hyphomonadaceae bacterium]|nr:MAG: hypothetical protein FD128_1379 [Hyphomonadaceae bacterium]KAF0185971.1 MAG: hypothetical protein FD163_639 [Hyphomonadaceae bacterium]